MSVASALREIEAAAAEFGAAIEEDVDAYQAVAPDGFVWNDSDGVHVAMVFGHDDRAASRVAALSDGLDRIRRGTRPMTAEERAEAGQDEESES